MPVVKIDEKGRIQLPRELRNELHLRPKQPVVVRKQGDVLTVSRMSKSVRMDSKEDPLLRDIIHRPLKSGKRITTEILENMETDQWSE